MRRTSLLTVLLAVAVYVGAPTPAFAQDIVKLNEEGVAAFTEGRFADAAQKFHEAYSIKPEAPLKKNEAVAWFKANKCSEALAAAKEYLALGIENDLSTEEAQTVAVKCYIQRAEAELASGNADSAAMAISDARSNNPTAEDQQTITGIEGKIQVQREADQAERQRAVAAAEAEKDRQEREDSRGTMRVLGLGLAGGGGAVVVGTLIYHIALATGTSSKFKDAAASGDREQYEKLGKRLETGNWLVPTLYALGLATSGVGVYLWWNAGGLESNPSGTARLGLESIGATATWKF